MTTPKMSEMVSECCGAEITRVKKWPKTGWPQLDWERKTKWKFKCSKCHNPTKPVKAKEKGE